MSSRRASSLTHQVEALLAEDSFVACLSVKHDALSQWRAYADNGAGYCIGFQARERRDHHGDDAFHWENHLVECLYGVEAVEKRLKERFQYVIDRVASADDEYRNNVLADHLWHVARRYAHVAKHGHFEEEAEWRIIVDAPKDDVQYRVTRRGLVPFRPTVELPIQKVWIGPAVHANPEVAKRSVTRFLAKQEITAEVDFWDSPFRR
jgi:hypothetical protein